MNKGDKFIVTADILTGMTINGQIITICRNQIIEYIRSTEIGEVVFNVNGREVYVAAYEAQNTLRELSYPIECPQTIPEFQSLINSIIRDMEEVLGVTNVSIEADRYAVKIIINKHE